MTVTQAPVGFARAFVVPDRVSPAIADLIDHVRPSVVQVRSGGPTIEDIVREELRPLLKAWLDTNLPPIVERLVRAEIERVVGRVVP